MISSKEKQELDLRIQADREHLEDLVNQRRELKIQEDGSIENGFNKLRKIKSNPMLEDMEFIRLYDALSKRKEVQNERQKLHEEQEMKKKRDDPNHIIQVRNYRLIYSNEEKNGIISLMEKYGVAEVSKAFHLHADMLSRWRSNKNKDDDKETSKRGRKITHVDIEQALVTWVKDKRSEFNHISVRMLILKGKELAKQQIIPILL